MFYGYCSLGRDPFNQNSDRSDREKWSTSKGGPVFSRAALKHGIRNPETETEYGIRERKFQAIDLKKKC